MSNYEQMPQTAVSAHPELQKQMPTEISEKIRILTMDTFRGVC